MGAAETRGAAAGANPTDGTGNTDGSSSIGWAAASTPGLIAAVTSTPWGDTTAAGRCGDGVEAAASGPNWLNQIQPL